MNKIKKKLYNFLADVNDYQGLHFTANRYRNYNESVLYAVFNLLTIWAFPIGFLYMYIITGRSHTPNCKCKNKYMDWIRRD